MVLQAGVYGWSGFSRQRTALVASFRCARLLHEVLHSPSHPATVAGHFKETSMLPSYGVLIGDFVSSGEHLGQWLHAIINMNVNGVSYQCEVDVNEPNLGFQYRIFKGLDPSLFPMIPTMGDGYHELA